MSSVARIIGRLLTTALLSTAVALGPTALSGPGAMAAPGTYIEIGETRGPPGTDIAVTGYGFGRCYRGEVTISMDGGAPSTTASVKDDDDDDEGTFESVLTVSEDADPGDYTVSAVCVTKSTTEPDIEATATFTVEAVEEAVLTLDPTDGRPETEVTADGSGFDCPSVDVTWDDGSLASEVPVSEGTFTTSFQVPLGTSEGSRTVWATCTDNAEYGRDDADFTVTAAQTNGTTSSSPTTGDPTSGEQTTGETSTGPNGETSGETDTGTNTGTNTGANGEASGNTDGGTVSGTGSVDNSAPAVWAVGSATLGGVLLLAAAAFALVHHHRRGPRWVHDHISTVLRDGTESSGVREPDDDGPPTRTVRLEPHIDPGDQSIGGINRA